MSQYNIWNSKGALTVEVSIVLPIFMVAVLTIAFFTRVVYIQNTVQASLNQAALELSSYAYVLEACELMQANEVDGKKLNEEQNQVIEKTKKVLNSMELLQKSYGDIENSTGNGNGNKKELIDVVTYVANNGLEQFKTYASGEVVKHIMFQNINKMIFRKVNAGAYIEALANKEMDSFNFEKSSIFKDNKTIDLVVRYTVKIRLPINILPEIKIEQRSTVAGWVRGDSSCDNLKLEYSTDSKKKKLDIEQDHNYWELSVLERGRLITKEELAKAGNAKAGEVIEVRSINMKEKSYEKDADVLGSIRRDLVKLQEKTKNNGVQVTRRTYLLVLPEATILSDKNRFESIMEKVRIEALTRGIEFKYIEGYGKS